MTIQSHISACLREIEKKLNWGSSNGWTNQDFELLVEEIYRVTGTNLSLTTLKRIWGKVDYQSQPSISTLNVLAQYLGYVHWRDYQNNHNLDYGVKNHKKSNYKSKRFRINQKMVLVLVLIIALSSLFFLLDRRQVFYNPSEVVFESKKVTTGLPNTVIFNYDVSKVIADSFHIQQSWDHRRRVRISPEETTHTSFYYYPGYFHAKLIANNEIIKEHEILIESNGWIGMIERFPEPVYINVSKIENDVLQGDFDIYLQNHTHFRDRDFWVDYYYVENINSVDAHDFDYSCRIKNNTDLGGVCRESRISVICTKGRYNIPLCEIGCVSEVFLTLGNLFLDGRKEDLSGLGCDLNEWINFNLLVEDKKCQISINDEVRLVKSFTNDIGEVVGLKFKFNGVGQVDCVRLIDHEKRVVFNEDFGDVSL